MPEPLTVFISSPADVADERTCAKLVIEKLAREYRAFFTIEPYQWEYDAMLAHQGFQDSIRDPSSCDIVVLILWSRLGSPLPPKTYKRAYVGMDGRSPVTGTEWEWEEALEARKKKGAPDLLAFRNDTPAQVPTRRSEQQQQSFAQLGALNEFWSRHFDEAAPFHIGTYKYTSLDDFALKLESALRSLIKVRKEKALSVPIWPGEPFRGLETYDFKDAPIFFGRDAAIGKAVMQLNDSARAGCAFLLVSGGSGTGKSSLVKAGIVPSLMAPPVLTDTAFVRRVLFRPGAAPGDVFLGLAEALTREGEDHIGLPELLLPVPDVKELAKDLRAARANPRNLFAGALVHCSRAHRHAKILQGKRVKLVLVLDQLEELFTVANVGGAERRDFIELLSGLARSGTAWVIATMRNDFWPRAIEEVPELIALADLNRRMDVPPPSPTEIADMIRLPAQAAGLSFDCDPTSTEGLDSVLAKEAGAAPAVLPLLSFVLDALHQKAKRREDRMLKHEDYAGLGGLHGAIAHRADETLASLPAQTKAALPRILRVLVTIGADGGAAAARVAPLDDFATDSAERALIDGFVGARLFVSASTDQGTKSTIRVAHEALFKHWLVASEQIRKDRRNLQTRALLQQAQALWRISRDDGRLVAAGEPLADANALLDEFGHDLSDDLLEFIDRSQERNALADAAKRFLMLVRQQQQQDTETADKLAAAPDPNSPPELLKRAGRRIAAAQQAATTLPEREAAAQQALDILDRLIAADPAHWAPRRALAICRMTIGDLAEIRRDRTAARTAYEQAAAILESSEIGDAERGEAQRMGTIMRMRLCDLLVREDRIGEALEAYRATLASQQQLVAQAPARFDLQEDLCRLHGLVGNLLLRQGNAAEAIESFEAGLGAAKTLPWQLLGKPDFQHSLASLHQNLAYALYDRDQSDPVNAERALAAYARARTVMQNLIDFYPNYPPYRRELALLSSRIGGLLHQQDKREDALQACETAVENLREMTTRDAGNPAYERDLALVLHKLGEVHLKTNPAAAIKAARECTTIRAALFERDPDDAELAFALSATHDIMAKALAATGDFKAAVATLRQGVQIAETSLKTAGGNPARRADVAFFHSSLAAIHKQANDLPQAEAAYRRALSLNREIAEQDPRNPKWIREVLYSHERMAELLGPARARIELSHALAQAHLLKEMEPSGKSEQEAARIQQKLDKLAAQNA